MLPPSLGCSHNHYSKVTARSSIVGGPSRSSPVIFIFTWLVCVTPIFILPIYSSNLMLFLLNLAPSSSSSRSLKLLHQMASCNWRIPLSRSSCLVRAIGVVVGEILFAFLVSSHLTPITCRFSWGDGCIAYSCTLCCMWVPKPLRHGRPHCVRSRGPPNRTCIHLIPSCPFHLIFLGAHHTSVVITCNTPSSASCCFYSMIEVLQWLSKSSPFIVPSSVGHVLTSIFMNRSDLIIILQLKDFMQLVLPSFYLLI